MCWGRTHERHLCLPARYNHRCDVALCFGPARNLDQLNLARATGDAFQEFQEGPLCFAPSYKYIPGTRKFDTR